MLCDTHLLEANLLDYHGHLKKDCVKNENIFTEGLEKIVTYWFALLTWVKLLLSASVFQESICESFFWSPFLLSNIWKNKR